MFKISNNEADTGNLSTILKNPIDGVMMIQARLANMVTCKRATILNNDCLIGDFQAGIDLETLSAFIHEQLPNIDGIWLRGCIDNNGFYTSYRIYNHYPIDANTPQYRLKIVRENYNTALNLYKSALERFELMNKSLLENMMVKDIGKLSVYLKAHLKLLNIVTRHVFSKEDMDKLSRLYQQTKALQRRSFVMDKTPKAGFSDPITFIRMFHEQYGYPVMCPYNNCIKFVK